MSPAPSNYRSYIICQGGDGVSRRVVEKLGPARFAHTLIADTRGDAHRRQLPGHSGKCPLEGCRCAPNPVAISGNVTEVMLMGPGSERLKEWALAQSNPEDRGRPYKDAYDAFESDVKQRVISAVVRTGVCPERAAKIDFNVCALLENKVERDKRLQLGRPYEDFFPSQDRCAGTPGQAPHRDGGRGTVQASDVSLPPPPSRPPLPPLPRVMRLLSIGPRHNYQAPRPRSFR